MAGPPNIRPRAYAGHAASGIEPYSSAATVPVRGGVRNLYVRVRPVIDLGDLSGLHPDAVRFAVPPGGPRRPAKPLKGGISGPGAEPAPYRLDFLSLGIPVAGGPRAVTAAGENNAIYFYHRYIAEGKLLLFGDDSQHVEALLRVAQAIGVEPDRFRLHVVEETQPNAWIIRGTGVIFVTTGLLKKPNLTEGGFKSDLGHEVGHYLSYQPRPQIPERFRNPLFRRMILATHAAGRQAEEYHADEIGLLITDASGSSVDEAVEQAIWWAETGGEKGFQGGTGGRILRPGGSHPHGASRVAATARGVEDPRLVWRNRGVSSRALPFAGDRFTRPGGKSEGHIISDPLDLDNIRRIAENPRFGGHVLTERNAIFIIFKEFREKEIRPGPKAARVLQDLRGRSEEGDFIAGAYSQALIDKIFFDALKKEEEGKRLEWLEKSCGISKDEVMAALIAHLENYGEVWKGSKIHNRPTFPSNERDLKDVISPFDRSPVRDQLIGALLRFPDAVEDRDDFIDVFDEAVMPWEMNHLAQKGLLDLVRMLHGPSIVDLEGLIESVHALFVDKDRKFYVDLSLDFTWERRLIKFLEYLDDSAGVYDRGILEDILHENSSAMAFILKGGSYINEQRSFWQLYEGLKGRSRELDDPALRERVLGVARLVLLRHLEVIPVKDWRAKTIASIEGMAPSTERNHLLILLDQSGRRPVRDTELVFRDIPSADDPGAFGDMSLLNSFGFFDPHAAEGIYPSGQRVLDRFLARKLPEEGGLSLADVLKTIPRASPIRDELLNRCETDDAALAGFVLDAYWSPAAAYAKAHQLATVWMEKSQGDQKIFDSICEITREFPSLKRRMVTAWADAFGIGKADYEPMLRTAHEVDCVDLYRGGAVEYSRRAPQEARAATCLASFALALSREGYSLLSLQSLEGESAEEEEDKHEYWRLLSPDEDALREQYRQFIDYHPLLAENAASIAHMLCGEERYGLHRIPFVDGRPLPNPRFQRDRVAKEGLDEMTRWEGGKVFSHFMTAMGWEEATAFYEELLLGPQGVMSDTDLFQRMEGIFLEGIGLLLADKDVPLARADQVKEGLRVLLAELPKDVRGRVWARILAGIVQQQSLGEIVREAVKPLGPAGAKLMQAVHSLTTGVDATLEEATRMALDQTARFTLFDALQFLGSRGIRPFERHDRYRLLGQGSVRAAIAGEGGPEEDSAYLLVHALPSDPRIIRGIGNFIRQQTGRGKYFPLSPAQFGQLVEQTEEERRIGFENHERFWEFHNGRLGGVRIPKILEHHGDWARIELVEGVAFTALTDEQKREVAPLVVEGAMAQFEKAGVGPVLVNPEFHGGNILYDALNKIPGLPDCGLIGEAGMEDLIALSAVYAGFTACEFSGAAAALLGQNGIAALGMLKDPRRADLLAGLKVLNRQFASGTAPELLLSGLAAVAYRSLGKDLSPGLEILFRGLQHLAPYLRRSYSGLTFPAVPFGFANLAEEIRAGLGGGPGSTARKISPDVAVGKVLKNKKVLSIGVLAQELDLDRLETDGYLKGMLKCVVKSGEGVAAQYVRPAELRIQTERGGKLKWVEVDEYLKPRR